MRPNSDWRSVLLHYDFVSYNFDAGLLTARRRLPSRTQRVKGSPCPDRPCRRFCPAPVEAPLKSSPERSYQKKSSYTAYRFDLRLLHNFLPNAETTVILTEFQKHWLAFFSSAYISITCVCKKEDWKLELSKNVGISSLRNW